MIKTRVASRITRYDVMVVNRNKPPSQMIKECGFNHVLKEVNEGNFRTPPVHGQSEVSPVIVSLCENLIYEKMVRDLVEIKPKKLRPADLSVLLAFVQKHPELCGRSAILAPGSIWAYSSAIRFAPAVYCKDGKKVLGVISLVPTIMSGCRVLTIEV